VTPFLTALFDGFESSLSLSLTLIYESINY